MSELFLCSDDPEVGAVIRAEREKRGLTLTKLASLARISTSSVSRYESGTKTPGLAMLEAIRGALESVSVLTAEEMERAEAAVRAQKSERMKKAREAKLLEDSPERTMRSMVSEATSPILRRILALEHKGPKIEDRLDRLEDRADDLDDRTASVAKAQTKAKAAQISQRAPRAPSMERIKDAARAEAMDLYEDRIRLLEAELEAQTERAAKMEKEMRRRGWL